MAKGIISSAIRMAGVCGLIVMAVIAFPGTGRAIEALPTPAPQAGGYGLEATKKQAPPTLGATIVSPGSGASFSSSPITVSGVCPKGLLVQIYDNDVMVGAVMCTTGSFSIEVSLFAGTNELKAIVYDDLYQAGPISNIVTITFTDTNFTRFGDLITLTSSYGRRSAANKTSLAWPLQLSGGMGPYAFSIDWGDGTEPQLLSQSFAGLVTIAHTYKKAGIYQVNVNAADTNGVKAFLQVIAVSNGEATDATTTNKIEATEAKTTVLWTPTIIAFLLLLPTYWLGRRSQLVTIRHTLIKERDRYEDK